MANTTRVEKQFHAVSPSKLLDLKLGYALLGDRRVPLRYKVTAFGIGFALVAILACLELPVEELVAVIPFLGIVGDLAVDGAEAIYLPILVACLTLPYLVPATLVEKIRRERDPAARSSDGPIVDI